MFYQSLIEVETSEVDIGLSIRDKIQRYGVCIVKSVLNTTECDSLFCGITDTLSYASSNFEVPFDIRDPKTWKSVFGLKPTKGMMYQSFGLGQCQTLWNLRCNQKIIDVYNSFYGLPNGSKELLCSFDAFSFLCPPEVTKKWYDNENWYHFDHNLDNHNFETLQSWVTATDVNSDDATLSVLIYSNLLHSRVRSCTGVDIKGDFVMMKDYVDEFKKTGCVEHRISCPKGSLVLWDSRLLHYGAHPIKGRSTHNFRCVAYICYSPRSLATKEALDIKLEALTIRSKNGFLRTTNHFPHRPKLFPDCHYLTPKLAISKVKQLPSPLIPIDFRFLTGI